MNLVMRLFLCSLFFFLIGCSYLKPPSMMQGQNKEFANARSIPPVRILPGMKTNSFRNDYPIADRNYANNDKMSSVNITPPGLLA